MKNDVTLKQYNIEFLREKAIESLLKVGVKKENAYILVDSMLEADICGVHSHGIRMLPSYIQKCERGEFSYENPTIEKQTAAFTIVDAKNNIGAVSMNYITEVAIKTAMKEGIHTVFSRNANTFGAGFYYVEKIANASMIGFACCNAPAAMPAFNGLEAILGTNPLAFSFPTKSYGNVVMDMATSVVAKSKFGIAKEKGEKLKEGWALNKDGEPTTDPEEGIKGLVLPMAGFKGYEIAMMIDTLAGFLSGSGYLNKVGKFYSQTGECMNVGHMVVAFNPKILYEGEFLTAADNYIKLIKESQSIKGQQIIIPGENKRKYKRKAMKEGISLPLEVVKKLEFI